MWRLVTSAPFENLILFLIIMNTVSLMMKFHQVSFGVFLTSHWQWTLTRLHYTLSLSLWISSHWPGSTVLCRHPRLLQPPLHHPLHYWMLLQGVCSWTEGINNSDLFEISRLCTTCEMPVFVSELLQGLVEHIWLCHSCRQHRRRHKASPDWISQTLSSGATDQASQEIWHNI